MTSNNCFGEGVGGHILKNNIKFLRIWSNCIYILVESGIPTIGYVWSPARTKNGSIILRWNPNQPPGALLIPQLSLFWEGRPRIQPLCTQQKGPFLLIFPSPNKIPKKLFFRMSTLRRPLTYPSSKVCLMMIWQLLPRNHLGLEMLALFVGCHGTTAKKGFMDKENMLSFDEFSESSNWIFLPQNLSPKLD